MYEKHFGLTSSPFAANAQGAAVYAGPQHLSVISGIQNGLSSQDAVVTVTGPVGVGKTTITTRALEQIHPGRMVAWVGRMQLTPDELFGLLLGGFGIDKSIRGTIRRIGAFRRYLHERAATGISVAIVVEDTARLGIETLIELEALTAADSGVTSSANIVLMGEPDLFDLLATPKLARLKQRVRGQQRLDAYSSDDVLGYMRHCIAAAGGDFDLIFDADVANIVYECSEGMPRAINSICDAALTSASESNLSRISADHMAKIATESFGYSGTPAAPAAALAAVVDEAAEEKDLRQDVEVTEEAVPLAPVESARTAEIPASEPNRVSKSRSKLPIGHDIVVESGSYPAKTDDAAPILSVADISSGDGATPSLKGAAPELPPSSDPKPNPRADTVIEVSKPNGVECEIAEEGDQRADCSDSVIAEEADERIERSDNSIAEEADERIEGSDSVISEDGDQCIERSDNLITEKSDERIEGGDNLIAEEGDERIERSDSLVAEEVEQRSESSDSLIAEEGDKPVDCSASDAQVVELVDTNASMIMPRISTDAPTDTDASMIMPRIDVDAPMDTDASMIMPRINPDALVANADSASPPAHETDTAKRTVLESVSQSHPVPEVDTETRSNSLEKHPSPPDNNPSASSENDIDLPTLSDSMRVAVDKDAQAEMEALAASYDPAWEAQLSAEITRGAGDDLPESANSSDATDVATEGDDSVPTPESDDSSQFDGLSEPAVVANQQDDQVPTLALEDTGRVPVGREQAPTPQQESGRVNLELGQEKAPKPQEASEQVQIALAETSTPQSVDPGKTGVFGTLELVPTGEVPVLAVAEACAPGADAMDADAQETSSAADPKMDIDALEAALGAAKQEKQEPLPIDQAALIDVGDDRLNGAGSATDLPEITLDAALPSRGAESDELDKAADEIGNASSLEDISDAMAETLFGNAELDAVAAAVVANPPENYSDGSDIPADGDSPVKLENPAMPDAANDAVELALEPTPTKAKTQITPAAATKPSPAAAATARKPTAAPAIGAKSPEFGDGNVPLNESVAMRIDILNKMKDNAARFATENVELGEGPPPPNEATALDQQPEPIEEQINTSITQTLKALDISRMAAAEAAAEAEAEAKEQKKSRGLFGRFKKSS